MTKTTTQRETTPVSLWVKLQTGLLVGILILLLVMTLLIGSAAGRIDKSFQLVQTDLEALEMDEINQAITEDGNIDSLQEENPPEKDDEFEPRQSIFG